MKQRQLKQAKLINIRRMLAIRKVRAMAEQFAKNVVSDVTTMIAKGFVAMADHYKKIAADFKLLFGGVIKKVQANAQRHHPAGPPQHKAPFVLSFSTRRPHSRTAR